jgi:hypothetical protein
VRRKAYENTIVTVIVAYDGSTFRDGVPDKSSVSLRLLRLILEGMSKKYPRC